MATAIARALFVIQVEYRDAPKRTFGPTIAPEPILEALAARSDVIGATVVPATYPTSVDLDDMSIGDSIRQVNAERAIELERLRTIAVERGWKMATGMGGHHEWWSEDKRCAWFDDEALGWKADGRLGIVVLNHERAALDYALGLA